MITNDQQLQLAQAAVENLQRVLLAARKVHGPHEYRLMSAPILLELQQREQEILAYLSRTETEAVRGQATVARQHLTANRGGQSRDNITPLPPRRGA